MEKLETNKEAIADLAAVTMDVAVQNIEGDLKALEGKKKLLLWIAGLSIALEIFIVNRYSWQLINGFSAVMFVITSCSFLYIAYLGLVVHQSVVNFQSVLMNRQNEVRHQHLLILSALYSRGPLSSELDSDFQSWQLVLKILDLAYFREPRASKEVILKLAKKLIHRSDEVGAYVLVIQVIASIIILSIN